MATLGIAAFGLIPTDQLRIKPDKPMYFYVVPLLRIKVYKESAFIFMLDPESKYYHWCRIFYLNAHQSSLMLIGEKLLPLIK